MIARLSLRHVTLRQAGMFRKTGLAALIALAAIGLAGTAKSQGVAQPPQVSPAQLAVAKQIVEIKGVKAMFAPLVHGVVKKTSDSVIQSNPMWAKDIGEISAQIDKDFQPRGQEIVDATARFYASHFTEAELKQILAFYQSPVGQKMLADEPRALDESMAYAGSWGDNLSIEVMSKLRAEMKKRGHDM
jgi:hypothetical protein